VVVTHVAFDLGLKYTGACWPGGSDLLICPPSFPGPSGLVVTGGDEYRGARLQWWGQALTNIVRQHRADVVAVEAPYVSKFPDATIRTVELHAVARLVAANCRCRYKQVPPSTLKLDATGHGNASKADMVAKARELGYGGAELGDDEADAIHVWHWWAKRDRVRGDSAVV
jgi:Holliday junction resolvasome RuvABC endonuclease subunit